MKKLEQILENGMVLNEYDRMRKQGMQYIGKLRSCQAEVWATDEYYVLRSYSTVVAIIDADGRLFDFLRYVYGYTATSAQHIAKFAHDYNATLKYTYREV